MSICDSHCHWQDVYGCFECLYIVYMCIYARSFIRMGMASILTYVRNRGTPVGAIDLALLINKATVYMFEG